MTASPTANPCAAAVVKVMVVPARVAVAFQVPVGTTPVGEALTVKEFEETAVIVALETL